MLVNHICKEPVNQKLPQTFADLLNLVHECPLSLVLSEAECLSQSSFKTDLAFFTARKKKTKTTSAVQFRTDHSRQSCVHKESRGMLGKRAIALWEPLKWIGIRLKEWSRNHQKPLRTAGSQTSRLLSHPQQNNRSWVLLPGRELSIAFTQSPREQCHLLNHQPPSHLTDGWYSFCICTVCGAV